MSCLAGWELLKELGPVANMTEIQSGIRMFLHLHTLFGFSITGDRFDTVKVRLQTSKEGRFKGPLHCVLQTIKIEGLSGFYKGATPPLVGWMVMDSV